MSNEKPDEFIAWRTLLGSENALPEQGLDNPEATWQRLNTRLGSVLDGERQTGKSVRPGVRARRRRIYRYGIAAAFLLLALIPANRYFRNRPVANRVLPGVIRQQADAHRRAIPAGPVGPVIADKGSFVEKPTRATPAPKAVVPAGPDLAVIQVRAPKSKQKRTAADRQRRATENVPLSVVADRPEVVEDRPGRVEAGAKVDSGIRLAVVSSPERKPLRVVSINEIDNPAVPGPTIISHRLTVPFRVSLNSRASALRMTTTVEEKEAPTLKIELNP